LVRIRAGEGRGRSALTSGGEKRRRVISLKKGEKKSALEKKRRLPSS